MQPAGVESKPTSAGKPESSGLAPVDDPRVYLAAERTFLAWVRTSVALMGFGFLIARFSFWIREYAGMMDAAATVPIAPQVSPWLGFGMVVVGVIVSVAAALRHYQYIEALRRGEKNPSLNVGASLGIALILALVGLAMSIQILVF